MRRDIARKGFICGCQRLNGVFGDTEELTLRLF